MNQYKTSSSAQPDQMNHILITTIAIDLTKLRHSGNTRMANKNSDNERMTVSQQQAGGKSTTATYAQVNDELNSVSLASFSIPTAATVMFPNSPSLSTQISTASDAGIHSHQRVDPIEHQDDSQTQQRLQHPPLNTKIGMPAKSIIF